MVMKIANSNTRIFSLQIIRHTFAYLSINTATHLLHARTHSRTQNPLVTPVGLTALPHLLRPPRTHLLIGARYCTLSTHLLVHQPVTPVLPPPAPPSLSHGPPSTLPSSSPLLTPCAPPSLLFVVRFS